MKDGFRLGRGGAVRTREAVRRPAPKRGARRSQSAARRGWAGQSVKAGLRAGPESGGGVGRRAGWGGATVGVGPGGGMSGGGAQGRAGVGRQGWENRRGVGGTILGAGPARGERSGPGLHNGCGLMLSGEYGMEFRDKVFCPLCLSFLYTLHVPLRQSSQLKGNKLFSSFMESGLEDTLKSG